MDDIRKYGIMDGFFSAGLADSDPELAGAIEHELVRQQDQIEMIAS
ncbi:MAG: serine hydroxymethyltransferase, partial [Pseudomonadota bacterium]|nr:serine hydroxymethyltransferase [Pseudomonadota bacterium]